VNARRQWQQWCPGVDAALEDRAASLGARLTKHIGGVPSRVLTWHQGGRDCSISMLLGDDAPPVLRCWAASWRDDERASMRTFFSDHEERHPTPVDRYEADILLDHLLATINPRSRAVLQVMPLTPLAATVQAQNARLDQLQRNQQAAGEALLRGS
jgi:hypothetical protein